MNVLRSAAVSLLIMLSNPALAGDQPLEGGQEKFVEQYLRLFGEEDFSKHWALVHPTSLDCMSQVDRDYYEETLFQKHASDKAVKKAVVSYELVNEKEIADAVEATGGLMAFPVMPSHKLSLNIDHEEQDTGVCSLAYAQSTEQLLLLQHEGKWYELKPCLSEKGKAWKAEINKKRRANLKKEQELYEEINPLSNPDIVNLLAEKRDTIAAMKLLAESNGLELTQAKALIDKACSDLSERTK